MEIIHPKNEDIADVLNRIADLLEAIRNSVGAILNRSGRRRAQRMRRFERASGAAGEKDSAERPAVDVVLAVDAEYRQRADAGTLKTIAPRRFNPEGKSWLPIMHTEKEGWRFTALYSNTARAHELNKTRDWVVVYFERNGEEAQCTVVTEQAGPLRGRRVVRGREKECRTHYSAVH